MLKLVYRSGVYVIVFSMSAYKFDKHPLPWVTQLNN